MNNLGDLGMGGALFLLALAQMFSFLKSRKANSGGRCPLEPEIKLWEQTISRGVVTGLNESLRPLIESQTRIMELMAKEAAETRRDVAEARRDLAEVKAITERNA